MTERGLDAALAALAAGEAAAAEAALRAHLAARPGDARAWQALGQALHDQRRLPEAEAAFTTAAAADPNPALARYHLGLLRLLQGDHGAGWQGWEARLAVPSLGHLRTGLPRWDGSPLPGGRVLLLGEQGFGDMLQFARFVPAAARASGAAITLGLPPELQPLFAPVCARWGVTLATGSRLEVAGFDRVAYLGSLPLLLGVAPEDFAAGLPWAAPDPVRLATWTRRRPRGLRCIGLCWEGRRSHPQDARRSIEPGLLAPLAAAGLLVGLQRPPWQRTPPGTLLAMDWGPDIDDFATAAAMLGALDLLVTVDTGLAHLAGSLGVPTRLLLPDVPDWRWGLTGETTPWYPSLRLLRQARPGDWSQPIAAACSQPT